MGGTVRVSWTRGTTAANSSSTSPLTEFQVPAFLL